MLFGRGLVTLVVSVLGLPGVEAQELPPEVLAVAHVTTTNRDLLKNLRLYTCLETIRRARPDKGKRARAIDVVQLDVGVGIRREMYSWPGEASFSSADLGELVGHGMLATGLFSGFAKDLFVAGNGIIHVAGEDMIEGQRALRFSYRVPSMSSQWLIQWKGRAGQVGEGGFFCEPARPAPATPAGEC